MNKQNIKELIEREFLEIFLEILMRQCPFEIPEGEEELAREILQGVVFGGKMEVPGDG